MSRYLLQGAQFLQQMLPFEDLFIQGPQMFFVQTQTLLLLLLLEPLLLLLHMLKPL